MASEFVDGSIISVIKRYPFAAASIIITLVGFLVIALFENSEAPYVLFVGGAVLIFLFYLVRQDASQQQSQNPGQPASAQRPAQLQFLRYLDRATDALAESGHRAIWGRGEQAALAVQGKTKNEPEGEIDKSTDQRQVIIKTYGGSQESATALYQVDATKMAAQRDVRPVPNDVWLPGEVAWLRPQSPSLSHNRG